MAILLFSDSHVRPRAGDEQFALTQIVDAAIASRVKAVIAAGDLLDQQVNRAAAVAFWCQQLDRLESAEIPLYYIQGQHERDTPPWLSAHRHPIHLHKKLVHIDGFFIYGLDWCPGGVLQDALAEIPPDADTLIAHQVWGEWMGDITVPQGEFAQVPEQIQRLYTGDLHQARLEWHPNAGGMKMHVLSTGATSRQRALEPTEHFYGLLSLRDGFSTVRLRSRVHIDSPLLYSTEDVDRFLNGLDAIMARASQETILRELPPHIATPTLRVIYSADVPDAVRRITKAVGDRATLSFKEQPIEAVVTAADGTSTVTGELLSPLNALDLEVDKELDPETHNLVARLLGVGDPAEEFARWRSEYMHGGELVETTDEEL